MAHFVAFGGDIAGVVLVDGRQDRHLVDHLQIEAAVDEGVGLFRVVRQQPHFREAQVLEQLNADAVIADVGFVAQGEVGFDGIQP